MLKKIAIHQPDLFSYYGFFDKIYKCDELIFLDHVQIQISRKAWTNRDRIKTTRGIRWFVVPLEKVSCNKINDIYISSDHKWKSSFLNLIYENYKNAKFFNEIYRFVEECFLINEQKLIDFNLKILSKIFIKLGIKKKIHLSSQLNPEGHKNLMLINLIKNINGDVYLSGAGAKAYIDENFFLSHNIKVLWNTFSAPVYEQLHGKFEKDLSILDILFNCGFEYVKNCLERNYIEFYDKK
jgi:hypothetical protein